MKPQNNHVFINYENQARKELEKQLSKSGIVLPTPETGVEERALEIGEIVYVPEKLIDVNGDEIKIKIGDRIVFSTFTTFDLKYNGKEVFSISGRDIISIL